MNAIGLLSVQSHAEALATDVARSSPDHGPRHWRDVARVGMRVGQDVGLDPDLFQLVFVFAAVHDTQRLNEFDDPDHGQRAAEMLSQIKLRGVYADDRTRLKRAIELHDTDPSFKYTSLDTICVSLVATCWDADRLTLGRVGIQPEREFMSTEAVRSGFDRYVAFGMSIVHGDDLSWQEIAEHYCV